MHADTHIHWTREERWANLTLGTGDKNHGDRSNGKGLGGGNVLGLVRETKSQPLLCTPEGRSPEHTLHSHPPLIHTYRLHLGCSAFREGLPLTSGTLKPQ